MISEVQDFNAFGFSPNLARRVAPVMHLYTSWAVNFARALAPAANTLRYVRITPGSPWINVGITDANGKALRYGWDTLDRRWSYAGSPPADVLAEAVRMGLPQEAADAAQAAPVADRIQARRSAQDAPEGQPAPAVRPAPETGDVAQLARDYANAMLTPTDGRARAIRETLESLDDATLDAMQRDVADVDVRAVNGSSLGKLIRGILAARAGNISVWVRKEWLRREDGGSQNITIGTRVFVPPSAPVNRGVVGVVDAAASGNTALAAAAKKETGTTAALRVRLDPVGRKPATPEAAAPAPAPVPRVSRALPEPSHGKRLRELADAMQEDIDYKLSGGGSANQNWTERRGRMMEGMRADGERLLRLQARLRGVADLQDSQQAAAVYLDKVKTKADIEKILGSTRRVHKPHGQDPEYAPMMPYAIDAYLRSLASDVRDVRGLPKSVRMWIHYSPDNYNEISLLNDDLADSIEAALKHANIGRNAWYEWLKEMISAYRALYRLGITDNDKLTIAQNALLEMKPSSAPKPSADTSWRRLIGQIEGYVPTPPAIADRMANIVARFCKQHDIEGPSVLEPSAGNGNLVKAVIDTIPHASVDALELSPALAEYLTQAFAGKPRILVMQRDFMKTDIAIRGRFDAVVMNPPFEKMQDIDHVRHAYTALKPVGILVAIMSESPFFRQDRRAEEFREWLEDVGGTSERLPEGAFKEYGTGVASRMVVIRREE